MHKIYYIAIFLLSSFYSVSQTGPFNRLIWSDEFTDFGKLDTSKWFHQTKLPNGNSWYNGEIQHYTNSSNNSYQSFGNLNIVAKKEVFTDQGITKNYTSARLNSKLAFTYGRVEVRAKLPEGVGTWPAIWMLGKNINEPGGYWQKQFGKTSWPDCGEIDIMEHWGSNQNYVQSAMHTRSSFGGTINKGGRLLSGVSDNFHVYSVDWYEDKMVFSIDSVPFYTYEPNELNSSTWPFTEDQYILLNIAIEGKIDPAFTESSMVIDYVRIYDDKPSPVSVKTLSFVDFKIHPNPAADYIIIELGNLDFKAISYQITHLTTGLIVDQNELIHPKSKITTKNLKPGIYSLMVIGPSLQKGVQMFIKR